jgi:glycosyltransferase involved in cell wall biosynthesis
MEVILINNNSTDETVRIARKYPVTILHEGIQSSYAARNCGIRHAKGEVLAFTDADCVVARNWLKNLFSKYDDLEIGCFAGKIASFKPQSLPEYFADLDEDNHNQERYLTGNYLPFADTANVAYRREVFQDIGLFNANLKSGGDVDFGWRMVKYGKYKIVYESEAVVYHKHRTSLKGLYLQHIKYGEGMTDLQKLYPDSNNVSIRGLIKDIFRFSFWGLKSLPKNIYLYNRGKVSGTKVLFCFLKALCLLGMAVGRISAYGKTDDGKISKLLIIRYILSKLFLDQNKHAA